MDAGEKIAVRRNALRLSVDDLAKRSGIPFDRIESLESNEEQPSAEEYLRIATALGTTPEELMPDGLDAGVTRVDPKTGAVQEARTKKRRMSPTSAIVRVILCPILALVALAIFIVTLLGLIVEFVDWLFVVVLVSGGALFTLVEETVRAVRYLIHYRKGK